MKPYIPIILGTAREGRESEKVVKYVFDIVKENADIEAEILDVRDFMRLATVPAWIEDSEETSPWKEKVEKAAAYILVVPEYNHSFPGELKIVWDGAYKEYFGKKIGVVTVSSGGFGGVRALDSLLPVFQTCQLTVAGSMHVSSVAETMAKTKKELDEMFKKKIESIFSSLTSS